MMIYEQAGYELWLDTPAGQRLALLDGVQSGRYGQGVNDTGYFEIVLPDSVPLPAGAIRPNAMVEIWRNLPGQRKQLRLIGLLREWSYADQGGMGVLELRGPDQHELLNRRIIAYAAGSAQSSKTDYADDLMKAIIRENLGSSASAARDWTAAGLTVAADLGLAPTLDKSFAWKTVLTALQDIADTSREQGTPLYFTLVPVFTAAGVGFRFVTATQQPGVDRRGITRFGARWGNLENARLTYDYGDEANYIYAGGQGEGADRIVKEAEDAARSSEGPWARAERFVNASSYETEARVTDEASRALEDARPRVRLSGTLIDCPQTRFGVDWDLGDRVTCEQRGVIVDALIDRTLVSMDSDGNESISAKMEVEL